MVFYVVVSGWFWDDEGAFRSGRGRVVFATSKLKESCDRRSTRLSDLYRHRLPSNAQPFAKSTNEYPKAALTGFLLGLQLWLQNSPSFILGHSSRRSSLVLSTRQEHHTQRCNHPEAPGALEELGYNTRARVRHSAIISLGF